MLTFSSRSRSFWKEWIVGNNPKWMELALSTSDDFKLRFLSERLERSRQIFQLAKCFLPNSRASIDHAPGPIIARVTPSIAKMKEIHGSSP